MNSKLEFIQASKIIHLCCIYDDLLKKAIVSNQPLENVVSALELYSLNGMLDKELTDLFIKHVPLYSVGIKVKLSDDKIAIVKETFTERINNYKPIVQIIPTKEIIDLRTITLVQYRINLLPALFCGMSVEFVISIL